MKIFFYTTVFAPSVGGIEMIVETLCKQFVALGHEVVVATQTPGMADMPFTVTRQPGPGEMCRLLAWCDIHIQANISLKAAWVWAAAPRKTLYNHQGVYQRDDGTKRLFDRLKTWLACAMPGIANSAYTADRTGAEHIILNAYDDAIFHSESVRENRDRDLVFLGRLVSQKGCDNLIDALWRLSERGLRPGLTVIGTGPERETLIQQAKTAGVAEQVRFAGGIQGAPLAAELARHQVMVAPSRYEEPFGIVALEGLACGCLPVVSEQGGLPEAIGGHGFIFPNGNAEALADRLQEILGDMAHARLRLAGVENHLSRCRARAVAERYLAVFERHLAPKL